MSSGKPMPAQLVQQHQIQQARWPILAKRYFKALQLVQAEGWADLMEELERDRRERLETLASPMCSERIADEQRGAILVLNWLLRLKDDVKEFPK